MLCFHSCAGCQCMYVVLNGVHTNARDVLIFFCFAWRLSCHSSLNSWSIMACKILLFIWPPWMIKLFFWLIVLSSQMKTCGTWPELLIFFWTWRYVFPHFIPFFLSFFLFILLSEGHSFWCSTRQTSLCLRNLFNAALDSLIFIRIMLIRIIKARSWSMPSYKSFSMQSSSWCLR